MKQLGQCVVLTSIVATIGMASSLVSVFYLITPDANFLSVINNILTSILYLPLAAITNLIATTGTTIPAAAWVLLLLLNWATWAAAIMLATTLTRKQHRKTAEVTPLVPGWASAGNREQKKSANS